MKHLLFLFFFPLMLFSKESFAPWGKDASLAQDKKKRAEILPRPSLVAKAANQVILFRQKVLTKIDGPRSHFRPTSSRYMQLAIQRYGFLKGYLMGCDRLLRENSDPWIYRKIQIDGITYNYDPAVPNKYSR